MAGNDRGSGGNATVIFLISVIYSVGEQVKIKGVGIMNAKLIATHGITEI